jgi:hypothetical protein
MSDSNIQYLKEHYKEQLQIGVVPGTMFIEHVDQRVGLVVWVNADDETVLVFWNNKGNKAFWRHSIPWFLTALTPGRWKVMQP